MCDVGKKIRADAIGDVAKTFPINHARISRRAGDDHFRAMLERQFRRVVVIDFLVIFAQTVAHDFIQAAAEIHRRAVGQMAAVRQRKTHYGIARLQHRHVYAGICLRTGMRLNVGVVRFE